MISDDEDEVGSDAEISSIDSTLSLDVIYIIDDEDDVSSDDEISTSGSQIGEQYTREAELLRQDESQVVPIWAPIPSPLPLDGEPVSPAWSLPSLRATPTPSPPASLSPPASPPLVVYRNVAVQTDALPATPPPPPIPPQCGICLERPREVFFRPCGHIFFCTECFWIYAKTYGPRICTICGRDVNDFVRAYHN